MPAYYTYTGIDFRSGIFLQQRNAGSLGYHFQPGLFSFIKGSSQILFHEHKGYYIFELVRFLFEFFVFLRPISENCINNIFNE